LDREKWKVILEFCSVCESPTEEKFMF